MLRKGQQEEQNATNYMQEYDTGLQKMENFLKNRLSDDGDYIVDNASEDIDFQTTGI
jgi:hypothetical protein